MGPLPLVGVAVLIPVGLVLGALAGVAVGSLVTAIYFRGRLNQQEEANRRALRRGQAARTTTQGY